MGDMQATQEQYAQYMEQLRQSEQARVDQHARLLEDVTSSQANLARAMADIAQAHQPQPTQGYTARIPIPKIEAPVVPDPAMDFKAWDRGIDEWMESFKAYPDFDKARYIKQSLPESLRTHVGEVVSLAQMADPAGVQQIRKLVEARHKPDQIDEEADALASFDRFKRTTPDYRAYCDEFVTHMDVLARHGVKYSDKHQMLLLLLKAQLSEGQSKSIRGQMKTIAKAQQRDSSYEDARELLLTSSGDKPVTVAFNHQYDDSAQYHQESYGPSRHTRPHARDRSRTPIHFTERGRSWSRSRSPRDAKGKGKGKGKGGGKGWRPPCPYGSRCNTQGCTDFHPRAFPGSRSRSPKGKGKGKRSSSSRPPCRDLQRGECTRGEHCRFAHGGSPSRPRSPSFGRGHPSRSPGPGRG
jgi:hypothetical protein